jgi:aspartate dehydrogenase
LQKQSPTAIGLMGYGAINTGVANAILAGQAGNTTLQSVLFKNPGKHKEEIAEIRNVTFTDDPELFLNSGVTMIVEAAGQEPLRRLGMGILERGCDLIVTSIGVFTDDAFFNAMKECAEANGSRLMLASGALPGVNWMNSAAMAGVKSATITQIKPVRSWIDTPAADMVDLKALKEPTCFFEGSAREAASSFPKSSNITALLALSTAGLDETRVRTIADPTSDILRTQISFESEAGNLNLECQVVAAPANPSTGAEVPLTVIKALRNLTSSISYGV